jgi:glycosyltransferase involved in cell wall biosynthesis
VVQITGEKQGTTQNNRLTTKKIVYILGRFPALSETFVLRELLELEHQGAQIRIFSLFQSATPQGAEVTWDGKASVTCLSDYSLVFLLLQSIRYFFRSPIRFISASIAMLGHYRLRFLIGCRVLLFASIIATQLKRENVVHLHAHFASEAASVAQFTHLLTGFPYSFTAHANDIYLSSKKALAYKIKMAHFVITISAYNQSYLRQLVDQKSGERIHCVYNGLNLADFLSEVSDMPRSQKPPLILSVCRLVKKKGLIYLLHACRILADQGYSFTCHIVGDGPLRQQLEQEICQRDLSDRVVLLGARTHRQVMEMYREATIMALPCIITEDGDRDGIPTALIESLYAGIPSVSTTVSGIPELIDSGVNGLLVPPNDSAALADALARLMQDSELSARLAAAGRETVRERFNLVKNIQHLIDLFSSDEEI